MLRALLTLAAAAAALLPLSAQAAPDLPVQSPIKLIQQPGSCPAGYYEIGYVGPPGARWSICQGPVNKG